MTVPSLPFALPGLDPATLAGTVIVAPEQRPAGRHVALSAGRVSAAVRRGARLELCVAPDDGAFAAALITAFATPAGRPVAAAPASRQLLDLATRVAVRDIAVLIEGPTGSGKEGLARLIHEASPRRDAPLVAVNCAALPEAMLEATLFGHERGAFTGAMQAGKGLIRAADGGSLLLDEIAEMPLALQAKLLRALQEREVLPIGATRAEKVDVRLIACGNRDLAADVAAGRFRADLYYRLAVFPLRPLPLSQRPEDVPLIAAHWLLKVGEGFCPWLSPAALDRLLAHDWPGNVRELGNVLDRALVLSDGQRIEAAHLQFDRLPPPALKLEGPLPGIVRAHEGHAIRRVLAEAPSRRAAAARLGISERTLRYKLAAMDRPAMVQ